LGALDRGDKHVGKSQLSIDLYPGDGHAPKARVARLEEDQLRQLLLDPVSNPL
jgi:hypothetical protein